MRAQQPRWIGQAIRAHHYRCLDGQRELLEAQDAANKASDALAKQSEGLAELARDWQAGRALGTLSTELDTRFRQYHLHLDQQLVAAQVAQRELETRVEQATQQLKQELGQRKALERFAERRRRIEQQCRMRREWAELSEACALASRAGVGR